MVDNPYAMSCDTPPIGARLSEWFGHATAEGGTRVGVIAEIGVNHDGDAERAARLIHAAAAAGADAVKFQLFRAKRLLSGAAQLADYQRGRAADAAKLLDSLSLPLAAMAELREVARRAGVRFIVTPFSAEDVRDLAELGVDAVKIASPDAVNQPLLEAAADLGRPLLVSTGTCELGELEHAAACVGGADSIGRGVTGKPSVNTIENATSGGALLQCVSAYPTADRDAALGGIAVLRERYGVAVGYSDHTAAQDTGALAVAAGACLLEKHLTHDRSAAGPDHAASLEPAALTRYVAAARRAAAMLGPHVKVCQPVESDVRTVSRQSVCVTRDLPAGHVLDLAELAIKRPGTGLPAASLAAVAGRTLRRAVVADRPLQPEDLAA